MLSIAQFFLTILVSYSTACPSGAVTGPNPTECYVYKPATSWFDAEENCVTIGGHLASVHDAFTNAFLARLPRYLAGPDDTAFWLGGSFGTDSADEWSWTDGSEFKFTQWQKGYPFRNGTLCAASSSSDEHWRSVDCGTLMPSACKLQTTANNRPPRDHCPSEWTYFAASGFCYKTFHNAYSTWSAANSTCASEGGTLASIHSEEEQQFIKRLSGTGVPMNWESGAWDGGVWIGMIGVTNDPRTHHWTDGTPIDFDNWASGLPSDYNGCTAYFPDHLVGQSNMFDDHWENTDPCDMALRAFVCKKLSSK